VQLFKSKKVSKLEQELKSLKDQIAASLNSRIQTINDSIVRFPDYSITDTTNKYITSDIVYSVVNKIAETSSLIPFYSYIKTKDQAVKKLSTITARQYYTTKGLYDIKRLQIKALEDAPENDPLNTLLDTPNPYQSKGDFFLLAYIYFLLNGECIIWKERLPSGPGGGANAGKTKRLHIWAPDQVKLYITRTYPQTVTHYGFLAENGQELIRVEVKDIIHWKRQNPGKLCFNQEDFRGLPPIKALTNTLTRLDESDTRSVSMIKNGGSPGIMYNESIEPGEISQEAFDLQKKAYYDHITNSANAGSYFLTAGKMGAVSTGLNMADLKLLELNKIDFKRVCNVYKISDILFNSDAASTESNVREMIKQMYTNACLPMIYSLRDKLNKELAVEFDRFLDIDISEITELQDDILQMAQAWGYMPAAPSVNEQREVLNFEAIGDKEDEANLYNKPLIKQGYMFIEDVGQTDISIQDLQP
jgi:HK97 family phage portal protein